MTSIIHRYGDGSFVRTIAAILSLIKPQLDLGSASRSTEDSQTLAILDILSVLFISSTHAEVVVLGTTLLPREIAVELGFQSVLSTEIAQGQPSGGQVEEGSASKLETTHQPPRDIELSLINNKDEGNYRKPGNASISPDIPEWLHRFILIKTTPPRASHLEHLHKYLNGPERSSDDFGRYIIFYSFEKIYARLNSCVPGTNVSFISLVLGVSADDIATGRTDQSPPEAISKHSESFLETADYYLNDKKQFDFELRGVDAKKNVSSSDENERRLWTWLQLSLKALHKRGEDLRTYRLSPSTSKASAGMVQLAAVMEIMLLLEKAVSRSSAFWKLSMNKHIDQVLTNAKKKLELDQPEDASTDDIGDEMDSDAFQLDTSLFREWLKLVLQWTRAIRELKPTSRLAKVLERREIKISQISSDHKSAVATSPFAPLDAVIANIQNHSSLMEQLRGKPDVIKEVVLASAPKSETLANFADFTFLEDGDTGTFGDTVHCESVIACQGQAKIVGVSKRCCYLCDQLLSSMQVQHTGTHGKIYSWIPPPGIPADKLRGLLDDLQIRLAETLNSTHRRRQSLESFASSASEASSSEEEQAATAKPRRRIDLLYPLKSQP